MADVICEVEECLVKNKEGRLIPGVVVTCGRCEHATESCGTGENSIKRCFALMREECPQGEENFYVEE